MPRRSKIKSSALKSAALKSATPGARNQERADYIYRTAASIMCQKGYEATSMNDIANAVGLTKAGIYHYISGKEELLFEIMTFAMDMLEADVTGPAKDIEDPELRLRTIFERHARRILEVGGAVTILLEEVPSLLPAHRRTILARKREYLELVRHSLEDLAREGKLRDVDPTVAAFTLFGMIVWISRWYRPGGRLSPRQVLENLMDLAMNAVLKPEAERSRQPELIKENSGAL